MINDVPKGYLGIKEAAKYLAASPSTLRRWEKVDGTVKPKRTPTGIRVYSIEDLERLLTKFEQESQ